MIVAVIDPANTPHGYNWTFAFPMLLFIVIAAILYALFSRPHRRVPSRRIAAVASGPRAATSTTAAAAPAEPAAGGAGESADQPAQPAQPAADTSEGSEATE